MTREKNMLVREAKRILSESVRNVDRKKHLLNLFELRYESDNGDEPLSVNDISERTGESDALLRNDVKAIWKYINKSLSGNFSWKLVCAIREYIKSNNLVSSNGSFVFKLQDLMDHLGIEKKSALLIKDVLKSNYLIGGQLDPNKMYVVKRGSVFYLSSSRELNIARNDSAINSRKNNLKKIIDGLSLCSKEEVNIANSVMNITSLMGRKGSILRSRVGLIDGSDHKCLSLHEIGEVTGNITRERVRQVCLSAVNTMIEAESICNYGPISELMKLVENQQSSMAKSNVNIIPFKQLISENKSLSGFEGNEDGLYLLCKLSGAEGLVKKSGPWLLSETANEDFINTYIKDYLKGERVKNGIKKDLVNVTTMIPPGMIKEVKTKSMQSGKSMNDHYVLAVEKFIEFMNKVKQPVKIEVVDWKDKKNFRIIGMRLEKDLVNKLNGVLPKTTSRAGFLLTAVKREFGQEQIS